MIESRMISVVKSKKQSRLLLYTLGWIGCVCVCVCVGDNFGFGNKMQIEMMGKHDYVSRKRMVVDK